MSVNAPPPIHRRHVSQLTPFNASGNVTLDLDDIDGAGTAVDYVYLHFMGGFHPAGGTAATVTLTMGTVIDIQIQASYEGLGLDFGDQGILLARDFATTAVLTIGGAATGCFAVISY